MGARLGFLVEASRGVSPHLKAPRYHRGSIGLGLRRDANRNDIQFSSADPHLGVAMCSLGGEGLRVGGAPAALVT